MLNRAAVPIDVCGLRTRGVLKTRGVPQAREEVTPLWMRFAVSLMDVAEDDIVPRLEGVMSRKCFGRAVILAALTLWFAPGCETTPGSTDSYTGARIIVSRGPMTARLLEDGQTVVAINSQGQVIWKTNVIRACPCEFVGARLVNTIWFDDGGHVVVDFGKHSTAGLEARTGAFVWYNSD